jgi:hypothetical protein
MDLLRKYMQNERRRSPLQDSQIPNHILMNNLPTPYHATREFGEELLRVQGYKTQCIRDLFCIRSFALTHGISRAIHLINEHITESTNTFPHRLYETQKLQRVSKVNAASLERECLIWELAKDIPDPLGMFPRSETKHILSDSTIKYAIIAEKIVNHIKDDDVKEQTLSFFKEQIQEMINGCHILNLIHKINVREPIRILDEILRDTIIPNGLRAVHETSPPS